MKREIKFRGKALNGKWIYGMPTFCFNYILNIDALDSMDNYEVDPETIGQFTGLYDRNGMEIYEGHIMRITYLAPHPVQRNLLVVFNQEKCRFILANYFEDIVDEYFDKSCEEYRVIGNIHDNPELLTSEH